MKALILAALLATVSAGQTTAPSIAGTWIAQFEGRTFVRLELKTTNGVIAGTLSLGDVEVDAQGALRRVTEAPRGATPIFDVQQRASTVTFARKDGDDTDRFELRSVDARHVELHCLFSEEDRRELASIGIAVPKPFVLTKQP